MSAISPVRQTQRVAARRNTTPSSDNESEVEAGGRRESSEDEFTPAPQKTTRRSTRQDHGKENAATPTTSKTRRRKVNGATHISNALSTKEAVLEQDSTPKQIVTTGRRTVRAGRKSQFTIVPEEASQLLPTPTASTSPEPPAEAQTPLIDITVAAINEQSMASPNKIMERPEVVKIPSEKHAVEKPMDIVIRARSKPQPINDENAQPKSRIVLTYLMLTNFKSYAGKQEIGPFHSSFSSVVGPNGSGKSNVIDSLLFVFGFRASKMRQGKISALIHNSAAFPDLDFCEVEVHFEEVIDQLDGSRETVPQSSLIISRKAFKNNSSKYYINGSESNFTTVTTLLRDRGVDLDHKRFLILQGEVESIAQMKPKAASEHDDGLLEYLEDIIGTSKYKTSIEESASKVEELNEVCLEKNSRVQHVQKEMQGLEHKKDAALNFIRNENELSVKQSALYQLYVKECEDNIQVTEQAVQQIQAQLEQEAERHQGSQQIIIELKNQHAVEAKQLERMELKNQSVAKQLSKLDRDTVKFEEKKKHLHAKVKKLDKLKTSNTAAVSEAGAHLDRLSEDLQRNADTIAQLESRRGSEEQALSTIREQLKGKTQTFSDEITSKQKALSPWLQQINNKQSAAAVARSELTILRERDEAGANAATDIRARATRVQDARNGRIEELETLKSERSSLEKDIKRWRAKMEGLAKVEPDTKSRLSAARQKADEARASLSNSQIQGNVLAGLIRLKESGRINGFHGRLGNLGTIDPRYDVAISTACPALDNLVVDSVDVGHSCIEYLRKNNLGRANFILLDRLSQRDLSSPDTPEGIPRLFDLVKSKEDRFMPAFYSVLQNTLVADDLEQANRVAYGAKRWRVVTLDGQLIDKSGTMSGGGSTKAKGKMSSKLVAEATKQQLDKYEAEQEFCEREFRDLVKEQQVVDSSLSQTEESLPQLETRIQKCLLEIESLDRDLADAQRAQSELSSSRPKAADTSRVASLQATIASLENEIADLTENTSSLESEINALQEKIMEVGGVQLRGQKAKVDGLRDQINTLNDEISGTEVLKAKTVQQRKKHEKARDVAEAELALAIDELRVSEQEMNSQTQQAMEIKKQADIVQEELDEKRESVAAVTTKLDHIMAELNETRAVELEMRNKLEENIKVLGENQKRLKYWLDKLNKLNIHAVSDLGEELPEQSLPSYTRDELLDLDKDMLKGEIAVLEEKLQDVNVELGVVAEYRRRFEEHTARSSDLSEAVQERDSARKRCEELRRLRLEGFMVGFSTISMRLKEMYQMITMGGNAELELVDSLDPFSEGILFSVMPPKKSWKNISNLSGGEKTLSSLALVFALHHYKPTPLYVMDEIDAALDFRNVSIVASYIKERTKNAQFIVISLRNNMFELASRLVGVYKVNHMTKSVTVENHDYFARQN